MSFNILDVETEIARMKRQALHQPGRETEAGPSPDPQKTREHSVARLVERPIIQGEELARKLLEWSRAL